DVFIFFFFFQAEDGIRDKLVTGVQTCALPILIATLRSRARSWARYTVAIPPRPSSARTSYSPSVALRRASSWALCWAGSGRRTGGATVAPAPPVVSGTLVPQRRQKYAPGAREVPQRAQ